MAAQHTPGPWHVCTAHHKDMGPIRAISAKEGDGVDAICIVDQMPGCDESRANARLIAAAPDLLEALRDCREALRRAGAAGELAVVDAAIAKATGGASV